MNTLASRLPSILACLAVGIPALAATESESNALATKQAQRCATIAPTPAAEFRGKTLVEIPDIRSPEVKTANALLSNRCTARAAQLIGSHYQDHPEDYQLNYVLARILWIRSGAEAAAAMLQRVIAQHPDFISGRVLLAGMDIERNDIVAARAILDEVAPQSPTDVWIYLYQLRIQALSPQTVPGLRETLLAIANEPGFPGNVREIAARTGSRLANLTTTQFEEFLRVPLKFESGTAMPCKYATLARWLTDEGGRSRDVIALLESPEAHAAECGGLMTNRVLLAEAYLLEAAKISPGPTPANESLVAQATQMLDGDFGQLVTMLTGRPEFTTLRPFFGKASYVDRPDEHGHTPLCTAVYTRSPEALRVQLEGGANPSQKCSGWEPLRLIMSWAGPEQATERYEMARLLLEAGAPPGDLGECREGHATDCRVLLLPLLERYATRP